MLCWRGRALTIPRISRPTVITVILKPTTTPIPSTGPTPTQEENPMGFKRSLYLSVAASAFAACLAAAPSELRAQATVAIDNDDIGGVVTGPSGPEAGVWVIAETTDLPTKFIKSVVTDDQGRYVIPDLPKAKFKVWVRGYGLVDSPKVDAEPGKIVNHTAVKAPNDFAAAQYYPAIYWYSMINVPGENEFPGTGPTGNGINPGMKSQAQYLDVLKT